MINPIIFYFLLYVLIGFLQICDPSEGPILLQDAAILGKLFGAQTWAGAGITSIGDKDAIHFSDLLGGSSHLVSGL